MHTLRITTTLCALKTSKRMKCRMPYQYIMAAMTAVTIIPQYVAAQKADQNITLSWGEEYVLPKKHEDLGFVGNEKDGYIQIGHKHDASLSFQKFDNKLHLVSEKEAELTEMPSHYDSECMLQIGEKSFWFFSTWDRSENREGLYAQEIDLATGMLKGAAKEILHSTKLVKFQLFSGGAGLDYGYGSTNKWKVYYSYDKSKILVKYRARLNKRDDDSNNEFGLFVFDTNLNLIWGRETEMSIEGVTLNNEDYQVDNQGNVYTMANQRNKESRLNELAVLKWSKGEEKPQVIPFDFAGKYVSSAIISEDPKGEIIVSGYYSKNRIGGDVDGVFIQKLNTATNKMENIKKGLYEFPLDVLKSYESARTRRRIERKSKKNGAEAPNLKLKDVSIKEDGSIQVIGEESHVVYTTNYNGRTTTTTVTYYYDDIMAMSIAPDGELQWVKKIPKEQRGSGRGGGFKMFGGGSSDVVGEMSYKQFTFKKNCYFFFMDHKDNLELRPNETPSTFVDGKKGVMVVVKVDEHGKMTKSELFNTKEEKIRLTVTDFDEAGDNQIIVRGREHGRDSQAALITFQ